MIGVSLVRPDAIIHAPPEGAPASSGVAVADSGFNYNYTYAGPDDLAPFEPAAFVDALLTLGQDGPPAIRNGVQPPLGALHEPSLLHVRQCPAHPTEDDGRLSAREELLPLRVCESEDLGYACSDVPAMKWTRRCEGPEHGNHGLFVIGNS